MELRERSSTDRSGSSRSRGKGSGSHWWGRGNYHWSGRSHRNSRNMCRGRFRGRCSDWCWRGNYSGISRRVRVSQRKKWGRVAERGSWGGVCNLSQFLLSQFAFPLQFPHARRQPPLRCKRITVLNQVGSATCDVAFIMLHQDVTCVLDTPCG